MPRLRARREVLQGRGGTVRIGNAEPIPIREWVVDHHVPEETMPASLSGRDGRFRNTSSGREYVVHRFDLRCRMYGAPEVTDFTIPPGQVERAAGRQEYHGNLVMCNVDPIYDVRPGERGLLTVTYPGTGEGWSLPIYLERLETRPVGMTVAVEVSFISDGPPSEYRAGAITPTELRARRVRSPIRVPEELVQNAPTAEQMERARQVVNEVFRRQADGELFGMPAVPVETSIIPLPSNPSAVTISGSSPITFSDPGPATISVSTPPGTTVVRMEGSNDGRYVRPVYARDIANSLPSRRLTTGEEIEDFHRLRRARNDEINVMVMQACQRGLLSGVGMDRIARERSEYLGRLFANDYSRESMVAYDLWAVTTYNGLRELLAGRANGLAEEQQAQPTPRRRRAFHVNGPVTVEG